MSAVRYRLTAVRCRGDIRQSDGIGVIYDGALETGGRRFFMLFGMEPFLSRGSGEMKRGKTAITFPGIPPFWVAAYSVTSRGTMLFLSPPGGAGGTMDTGLLSQFMFMAITAANHTTGLRPWKCTPFGAAHHFPRRGKFALRSALDLISTSRHSAARISPSGGEAVGRRGAFPTRRRRGCMVCHRAKPGCKGFYTNWRPKGATTTL